jgi:hypothetical protein
MSLKKEFDAGNGVPAEYWRIQSVERKGEGSLVWIFLFYNQQAYLDGKFRVADYWHNIPQVDTFEQAYLELKKLPEFEGAEDA